MAMGPTPQPKGGDGIGDSGSTPQKGEKGIAMTGKKSSILSPFPGAPVNETDMVRLPQGRHAVKQVATPVGLDLTGVYLHRAAGCDATPTRPCIFHAGLLPNIPENPRNRTRTKRGRTRLYHAAMPAWRTRDDQTFAWEEQCKRLRLWFERRQQRHCGRKVLAYTVINLRAFCAAEHSQSVHTYG